MVIHLDGEMEKWDRQEGRQRQSVRQLRQQESGGRTDTALATVLDVTFFIHLDSKGQRKSDGLTDTLRHCGTETENQMDRDRDRKSDGQMDTLSHCGTEKIRTDTFSHCGTETENQMEMQTLS